MSAQNLPPVADQPSVWLPKLNGRAILETLSSHQVKYVLIGALGAGIQGFSRATADADITPEKDRDNLGRLAAALKEMDAKLRVPGLEYGVDFPLDKRSFDLGNSYTFVTRHGPLDVIVCPDGTRGYDDLIKDAITYPIFGIEVRVASLADIIRSKEAAGRSKDREDIRLLRELQERTQSPPKAQS